MYVGSLGDMSTVGGPCVPVLPLPLQLPASRGEKVRAILKIW